MPARRPRPDRALVVVPTLALVAEIIDRASIPRGALELDARSRPSSSAADRPWTSTSRAATRSIDSTIDCFTSTLISCTGRAPIEHRSSTDRAPIEHRSSTDRAPIERRSSRCRCDGAHARFRLAETRRPRGADASTTRRPNVGRVHGTRARRARAVVSVEANDVARRAREGEKCARVNRHRERCRARTASRSSSGGRAMGRHRAWTRTRCERSSGRRRRTMTR